MRKQIKMYVKLTRYNYVNKYKDVEKSIANIAL